MDVEGIVNDIVSQDLPVARLREGLDTLRKLLGNLRGSPEQEKFRQIKKTNPAIQSRLFPQCFDLLRAAGFEDSGDLMVFRGDPNASFTEVLDIVSSLLLSLGEAPAAATAKAKPAVAASGTSTSPAEAPAAAAAKAKPSVAASGTSTSPAESKRTVQQQRHEKARSEARQAEANAQEQLAALRRRRATQYQEQQDVALAHHLSGHGAEQPFDAITALNESRGATSSLVTCTRCGSSLRYNSTTRAQAVLCPCGMLLQPVHIRGQSWSPQSPSDLPVEPGEPVDSDNRPRATRGPFITVRGPDGEPTRLPLHSVLQMVRQHEERQQAGARDETIEALPTRRFEGGIGAAAAGSAGDDQKCQICMEEFVEGDELRTLPCFHLFHAACVDQWLKVNSICPTCRHKVG